MFSDMFSTNLIFLECTILTAHDRNINAVYCTRVVRVCTIHELGKINDQ